MLRPTTHLLYTSHVKTYLIPLLGHHRLDKVRAAHVRLAMEHIAEQAEVIAAENAARHAMIAAAKRAWAEHNPAAARAARTKLTEAARLAAAQTAVGDGCGPRRRPRLSWPAPPGTVCSRSF